MPSTPAARATSLPAAPDGSLRGPLALFRGALLGVCALLSVLPPRHPLALAVVAVLALGAWLSFHRHDLGLLYPCTAVVVAAAAVPWTGGSRSPLLPYLLATGLTLGLTHRVRELVLACGLGAATLVGAALLPGVDRGHDYASAAAQWVALSLALGLVAMWARHLSPVAGADAADKFLEVRHLLEQLRGLTRQLPGGLDAPSTAEALLDRCAGAVPHNRSAVLVQPAEETFVPLAVRGSRRVPWRAPLDTSGPLRRAWETRLPVLDVRAGDTAGRRQGSALLAIPLLSGAEPFGLVIFESFDVAGFPDEAVAALEALVEQTASQLEAAQLFEEVRLAASIEERDRLAREMHDGIAQELAFIGYRLDELRSRALKVDPELAELAVTIRGELTGLISDLRLSITDLRTTVRPDRGLGTALSTYLQAVCSGKDCVLTLSLQESAFRLPGDQEVALFHAAQAFAQEVRRSTDVREMSVSLTVDPPSARLEMWCDGAFRRIDMGDTGDSLARLGADVTISEGRKGGPCLEVVLKGGPDDDQRAAGRRPRADQARPPSRVRAD